MAMLRVHVHPGARHAAVHGFREDGALKLSVTAPPEGGRANRAVASLLAEALDLSPARVSVVRGHGSRSKWVDVEGLSEEEIQTRIRAALEKEGNRDH